MQLYNKKITIKDNPSFEDLAKLYDENNDQHKYTLLVIVESMPNHEISLQRKYTYSGGNVVKTNYLHGTVLQKIDPVGLIDRKEVSTFKQTKTGFKVASLDKGLH